MPQTMKDDARELRVGILPFQKLLADECRLHRQAVGQTEQHSVVKEGTETVAFGEAVKAEKSSDMSARGAPARER